MISKLKDIHWVLTILIGMFVAIVTSIWFIATSYKDFERKNDEVLNTIKTTQQMALKSVIWNDEIPLTERASACDVYLSAGYNSMTKKECEVIIEKASEQGVF